MIVAPCVGAWIEMSVSCQRINDTLVAPCVGAWIEIDKKRAEKLPPWGRSLRGSVD